MLLGGNGPGELEPIGGRVSARAHLHLASQPLNRFMFMFARRTLQARAALSHSSCSGWMCIWDVIISKAHRLRHSVPIDVESYMYPGSLPG